MYFSLWMVDGRIGTIRALLVSVAAAGCMTNALPSATHVKYEKRDIRQQLTIMIQYVTELKTFRNPCASSPSTVDIAHSHR